MEKRALIAVAISFVILLVWQALMPTPEAPVQEPVPIQLPSAPDPAAPAEPAPAPVIETESPITAETPEEIRVETDSARILLTNRGGRVRSWLLRGYLDKEGSPLELVPAFALRDDALPLAFDLDDTALAADLNRALFRVEREVVDGGETIRFLWADGAGRTAEKSLTFRRHDWLVDVAARVTDRGRDLPVRLTWGPGIEAGDIHDGGGQFHYAGQAVRYGPGGVERQPRQKLKQDIRFGPEHRIRWAGLEEQFFAALFIPQTPGAEVTLRRTEVLPVPPPGANSDREPKPEPQVVVAIGVPDTGAKLFVGPKRYTMLRELGYDLDQVVWFSSYSLIYWLAKLLFLALIWVHDNVIANYGLAIVVTTVVLRLIFFPLNQYSMVSMRKMQTEMARIQPKIKAIQAKHKKSKDPQARTKMNEEMMALYKREGVNPMGGVSGCLPLFAQFPILFGFYNMLTVAVELRGAPFFGWIRDLTLKDPYYVTPILMGLTMFLQQKMSMTKMGDPTQQRIMMMMPLFFMVMFLNLPSGLVLYWFVNNLLGIAQQWLVNRRIGRLETATAGKKA
jgi:YidC/Oxa1 family membrane protein insertase